MGRMGTTAMAIPQLKYRYSVEEYLRLERDADEKHDFYEGEIFAMAGGTGNHSLIISNFSRELGNRLKGGPCRVYDSNLRIRVQATDLYTYPDIPVICGGRRADPQDPTGETFVNPTLIVEVLSPSTERYDRGLKALNYRRIESLQEHVLVWQDMAVVESFLRQPDGSWRMTIFQGPEAVAKLTSVGVDLPLSDIYDGVTFPPPPQPPAGRDPR